LGVVWPKKKDIFLVKEERREREKRCECWSL